MPREGIGDVGGDDPPTVVREPIDQRLQQSCRRAAPHRDRDAGGTVRRDEHPHTTAAGDDQDRSRQQPTDALPAVDADEGAGNGGGPRPGPAGRPPP